MGPNSSFILEMSLMKCNRYKCNNPIEECNRNGYLISSYFILFLLHSSSFPSFLTETPHLPRSRPPAHEAGVFTWSTLWGIGDPLPPVELQHNRRALSLYLYRKHQPTRPFSALELFAAGITEGLTHVQRGTGRWLLDRLACNHHALHEAWALPRTRGGSHATDPAMKSK